MPTATYIALANTTLSTTTSSIVFGSIPNTYRDLIIEANIKGTAGTEARLRFNDDSSNIYSMVQMAGDPSGGVLSNAGTTTGGWINPNSFISASQFNGLSINILDYSATDKHKTYLSRFNPESGYFNLLAVRWANNNAIYQIQVYTTAQQFAIGSTFSLYGIVA